MSSYRVAMASICWVLLLFLAQLHTLLSTSIARRADGGILTRLPDSFLCHPNQSKALLQLKNSFSFSRSTTKLSSWRNGTDCCLWEGVGCDPSSGHVTVLDLNNRHLSSHGLDPALFSLISLRQLDLSMNNVGGNNIHSAAFERFTFLTHLNLSNSRSYGQIPPSISKLVNLLSLDLSKYNIDDSLGFYGPNSYDYYNELRESSFDTLVANLSNLRELYLDWVDLSYSGEEWGTSLAAYVPQLQILSLAHCGLSGPIHKSLSGLHSLVVINLQENFYATAGPFPEFFMGFPNLTVLQLSQTNLEGRLPSRPFQSKKLRVLDLSYNMYLSGHLPNFSNGSYLETLRFDGTNFSYARPTNSSNFKSLKELGLNRNLISVDFLSVLGRLKSLHQLELDCFLYNDEFDLSLDSGIELDQIFSWIGEHKNLASLGFFGYNFSGILPTLLSNFKNLKNLKIIDCDLPRPVLHAVGNLTGLQTLKMDDCITYGSMPSSVGNLTNLRNMYVAECEFSGPMPAAMGKLTNLRNMYIYDAGFSGLMPASIGNLTNLEAMEISSSQISGLIPYALGQLKKLRWLVLLQCKFSGSIPSSIVNLTHLTMLDLSFNSLYGDIPPSIFSLPALLDLHLSSNQLSGPIQGLDVTASQLEKVRLSNNDLSGFIPEAFFQLTSLVYIDVSSNKLIGSVDLSRFWRLSNELVGLDLSNNELHILDDNASLATTLAGLRRLGLASCNMTRFPRFLRHLKYISYLDLSHNKISGDVPNWIWETWNGSLIYLNLSHNMFTGMQLTSGVLPFTRPLSAFDVSFNRLTGQIPMPNKSSEILEYSNNRFSSVLPNWASYLRDTHYLSVSKNNINGHVPHLICNSMLQVIDLSYNKFNGMIPSCLIENLPLMVLNLRENHFEGRLPSNITSACYLQTMDLHGNKIEGKLPRGLSNCSSLEVLDLGGNRIRDIFPFWLRRLPKLSVMVLRSNQLYGTIGDIVGGTKYEEFFPSLQIIDLASNNFSGNLRPQWFKHLKSMMAEFNSSGKIVTAQNISESGGFYQDFTEITYKGIYVAFDRILTTLTAIDFSNNQLEGNIPESIGRLVSLRVLNLSNNAFTGSIPAQLGGMTALESLDLSCNQLSGKIPQELTDLTFLDVLNLSDNHLVGKVPQSRQFCTFDNSSFEGNAGLCGPPVSKLLCGASPYTPGVSQVDRPFHLVDVVLFLFVGLGFGVGFAAAILVRWHQVGRWFIATVRALRS